MAYAFHGRVRPRGTRRNKWRRRYGLDPKIYIVPPEIYDNSGRRPTYVTSHGYAEKCNTEPGLLD
ncbi:hypothetical protein LTR53_014550 [Teratosphaeriaceae sp. CCFEE 6253]|nr:hypothetical protein LTR53_014550 [Teratosphaeriaceae sp. CCFEE 6253]